MHKAGQWTRVVKSRKNFGIGIGISCSLYRDWPAGLLAKKRFFCADFLSTKKFFLQNFLCKEKLFFALFLKQKWLVLIHLIARNNMFMKKWIFLAFLDYFADFFSSSGV